MKHLILSGAALAATLLFASCGSNTLHGEGNKSTQVRDISGFDAVEMSVPVELDIAVQEGAATRVEVNGYENVMKHVKTEVKGHTLHVEFDLDDTWSVENDDDMKVRITMPALTALNISGASGAEITGTIRGSQFGLGISGAGAVSIEHVVVDKFTAEISGVGGLKVKGGSAKKASYELSGAGGVDAYALQTEETVASLSGVGGAKVWATAKLDASISGAGSIKYKGNPEVNKEVSGIGSVSAAD